MSGIQKYIEGGVRVNLHLHATNSDGDNTSDEVLRLATPKGMHIALTDHNKFSFVEPVTVGVSQCESSEHWN